MPREEFTKAELDSVVKPARRVMLKLAKAVRTSIEYHDSLKNSEAFQASVRARMDRSYLALCDEIFSFVKRIDDGP